MRSDSGVSEVVSSILMVFLIIVVAVVAGEFISGFVDEGDLEKPSFIFPLI